MNLKSLTTIAISGVFLFTSSAQAEEQIVRYANIPNVTCQKTQYDENTVKVTLECDGDLIKKMTVTVPFEPYQLVIVTKRNGEFKEIYDQKSEKKTQYIVFTNTRAILIIIGQYTKNKN